MMIPDDKISEIKNTADILEIISESVMLKRAGRNHIGLCPFHSEKTPSFSVNPDLQIFKCFGCGEGGNVFSFLMKHNNMSFPESVRFLGRRYGIDIPDRSLSPNEKRKISEKEALLQVNRQALNFFKENLRSGPNSATAQKYLTERGFSKETIETFELGYVSEGWDHLIQYFSKRRTPLPVIAKSGLIIQKDANRFYDRFRDRIMFPIFDSGNQVIGFGGRIITASKKQPKYLNSPETLVYHKKKSLYGLNTAKSKCRETGAVFIVEGYFDFLALHQHGVENTVATLGTSLTTEHARLLKGFASKIYLVFDSDAAGIKASLRGINIFSNEGIEARIIILPSGYDPDSFIFEKGPEAFLLLKEKALTNISYLIQTAIKKHDHSAEGKLRIIEDMATPLSQISDIVLKKLYIKELAEHIGIDETAIQKRIFEIGNTNSVRPVSAYGTKNDRGAIHSEAALLNSINNEAHKIEKRLVTMLLQFPDSIAHFREKEANRFFVNDTLKYVTDLILANENAKKTIVSDIISKIDSNELRNVIAALAVSEENWVYEGCKSLIDQFITAKMRRNNDLDREIKLAEESNDMERLTMLLSKKNLQLASLKKKQYISR